MLTTNRLLATLPVARPNFLFERSPVASGSVIEIDRFSQRARPTGPALRDDSSTAVSLAALQNADVLFGGSDASVAEALDAVRDATRARGREGGFEELSVLMKGRDDAFRATLFAQGQALVDALVTRPPPGQGGDAEVYEAIAFMSSIPTPTEDLAYTTVRNDLVVDGWTGSPGVIGVKVNVAGEVHTTMLGLNGDPWLTLINMNTQPVYVVTDGGLHNLGAIEVVWEDGGVQTFPVDAAGELALGSVHAPAQYIRVLDRDGEVLGYFDLPQF
jgi:hypothetical protein